MWYVFLGVGLRCLVETTYWYMSRIGVWWTISSWRETGNPIHHWSTEGCELCSLALNIVSVLNFGGRPLCMGICWTLLFIGGDVFNSQPLSWSIDSLFAATVLVVALCLCGDCVNVASYWSLKDCMKLEDTVNIQEHGGKILLIKYFVTIGLHKP